MIKDYDLTVNSQLELMKEQIDDEISALTLKSSLNEDHLDLEME